MADSSIAITQGSGVLVDTRTESTNSNHRQVIVIGDPSANGGIAAVDASLGVSVNVTNTSIPVSDGGSVISVDDGGSSITVDGTVAATQSGAWNITNISGTVSLPTGASTLTEQQTQTTSLAAIETAVELIDDAIYTDGTGTPSKAIAIAGTDGTNPQIISVSSSGHVNIADGGNSITVDGTVATTQSGTWNITDITGTISLPTGASTSAKQDTIITSVQLIDDTVYTSGSGTPSKGLLVMGSDGTNPRAVSVNADGEVAIHDGGNSITVDGTVTVNGTVAVVASTGFPSVVSDGSTAGTNAIHIAGTDGANAQIISTNAFGHINIADGGNSITVDGTVTATGTVTSNAGTGFPAVVTDGSTAGTTGIHILGSDGTNAQILSTSNAGVLHVQGQTGDNVIGRVKLSDGTDVADILDLTNSNPLTVAIVDGDGTQITSIGGGIEYAVDDVAGATDTGKLTLAVRDDALGTLTSADGDYTQLRTNSRGALWIKPDGVVSIDDNAGSLTVDGTVTANAGTGFPPVVTTGAGAGTTGIHILGTDGTNARLLSTTSGGALNIADNGGSLTVDGSVAATQSGTWSVRLTDGTDTADILDLTNSNPLTVAIVDGNGTQITSFGGGTQYTEGATNSSITGTAMLMEGAADTLLPIQGTIADGLLVNLGANNDVTVAGVSTAANQSTIISHLDGVEGLLTTIDADTSGILTSVQILDNAISGNEMQVDVVGGAIAHDDVGTSNNPLLVGGYASATAPASVSADGDAVRAWYLRNGAQATVLTAAGELIGGDATYGIDVDVTRLPTLANVTTVDTVTNITNQGHLADDAAFTPGTTRVMMAGFTFNDVTPDLVNEGDGGAARMSANRNIYTTIRDAAGNERGANVNASGQLTVSVDNIVTVAPHAVTNNGIFAVQSTNQANSGVDIGDVTINNLTTTPVFTQHNITGLGHGVTVVTTAGTDVALAGSTECKKVIIQAQTDNTTGIAVGGPGVDATIATGTGIFLYPGDSIELEIDNLADVFIDSLTDGEGVRYIYFT